MSKNRTIIAPTNANQILLTAYSDVLWNMFDSFLEAGLLPNGVLELLDESELIHRGEFANGELMSYCWGAQVWNPLLDEVQREFERYVEENPGSLELTIEWSNGVIERRGYLEDFPGFNPINIETEPTMKVAA